MARGFPPVVAPARRGGADGRTVERHRATREADGSTIAPIDALLFQRLVAPHLNAGYNLARWLTLDPDHARDAVENAALRVSRALASYRGGSAVVWFLAIVREAVLASLDPAQQAEATPRRQFGEERTMDRLLERLPLELREVLVLRELEGLSYEEIAGVARIPDSFVTSRLARARQLLLAWERSLALPECERGA